MTLSISSLLYRSACRQNVALRRAAEFLKPVCDGFCDELLSVVTVCDELFTNDIKLVIFKIPKRDFWTD